MNKNQYLPFLLFFALCILVGLSQCKDKEEDSTPIKTKILTVVEDLSFGEVTVGSTMERTLVLSNTGTDPLTITGISVPDGFSTSFSGTIPAGESVSTTLVFAPTEVKTYSGIINIQSDLTSGISTILVDGIGVATASQLLEVSGDLSYGEVQVNQFIDRILTIKNTSSQSVSVTELVMPSGFSAAYSGVLSAGESVNVSVRFLPTAASAYNGEIEIKLSASGSNFYPISGTGSYLVVYKKIYGATDVYLSGNFIVVKSNGLPDHKSPYYQGTTWASTLYEAYNGSNPNWFQNPNKIRQQNYVFKFPKNPAEASSKSTTPFGPIGVAINGVSFFNQYAAPGDDLANEANSFDQYYGHPTQQGIYHYHLEPFYLTTTKGSDALLGFLLDGFPVYGPEENGERVKNSDLDPYHGHIHATEEYPSGIYHYHVTDEYPYINGNGFFGTPGTITL